MTDISVIIPSNHDHHELLKIVLAICDQTLKPAEIIIIDSSKESGTCPQEVVNLCDENGCKLIYKSILHALPGQARNIGLNLSKSELIAFIDVQTIPSSRWLESSLNLLADKTISGVWGHTTFCAKTSFEKLIRDGFYGILPRTTLPGTVSKREVFFKVGQFIDWVRAGEDTEWMLRLKLMRILFVSQEISLINYVGISGLTLNQLLKKWYRNYSVSRELPHFFPQRLLLFFVIYPLIILIAFNWNYIIAEWRMDSPLYVGHITKIVMILPILVYVGLRGIVLPLQRGVGLKNLFPLRFIAITFICLLADLVKVIVFSRPGRKPYVRKY